MNERWFRIKQFLERWGIWIGAAIALLAGLSAARRANIRLDKVRDDYVDGAEQEIELGWNDIADANDEVRQAQDKAEKVKENAQKQLDRMAKVDRSSADIISDWNSANRLSGHQDAP